ncbi:predicted protein [Plenodomus lingam JN3]|uniref:Predicted protein n=1 Tax=Leptosphaeria maculans (strain JN3 / isolate v23.1.3 / race Av1-4-5-6-7-8) TaxID=985895 RepID=E5A939_LEPMJ|nr:predicted protein [Plenodomus lingam JN3]CBY00180.1 predicted protein [Plenodomus lingam JN3]
MYDDDDDEDEDDLEGLEQVISSDMVATYWLPLVVALYSSISAHGPMAGLVRGPFAHHRSLLFAAQSTVHSRTPVEMQHPVVTC